MRRRVVGLLALALVVSGCGSAPVGESTTEATGAEVEPGASAPAPRSEAGPGPVSPEGRSGPEPPADAAPEPPADAAPEPPTASEPGKDGPAPERTQESWTLVEVVDGDTIDVRDPAGRRETVRLIGIDAPERGDCGFHAATETLAGVLGGREIDLIPGAEDERDRYRRLLRYVEVGSRDAGRVLIEHGLAIARYDSRDGYGAHPREADYVAADEASENVTCGEAPPPPATDPVPPPAPTPRREDSREVPFENCDQAREAGAAPVQRGEVGYGTHLDGDDDGIACE